MSICCVAMKETPSVSEAAVSCETVSFASRKIQPYWQASCGPVLCYRYLYLSDRCHAKFQLAFVLPSTPVPTSRKRYMKNRSFHIHKETPTKLTVPCSTPWFGSRISTSRTCSYIITSSVCVLNLLPGGSFTSCTIMVKYCRFLFTRPSEQSLEAFRLILMDQNSNLELKNPQNLSSVPEKTKVEPGVFMMSWFDRILTVKCSDTSFYSLWKESRVWIHQLNPS